MKTYISVTPSGEILNTITSNDPGLIASQGTELVEITDEADKDKVKVKASYFKVVDGVLVEKSQKEKGLVDIKEKLPAPRHVYGDLIKKIDELEKKVADLSKVK